MAYSFAEICPYIREAGLQHRDSWKNIERRIYDHQFLYCFTGKAHVKIQNSYSLVQKGDLVVIPPNVPHCFWTDEESPGELYWFHCDFFFFDDRKWLFDIYNDPERYVELFGNITLDRTHIRENPSFEEFGVLPNFLSMEDPDRIEYLFQTIYTIYQRHDRFLQLSAKSSLLNLLEEIFRQVGETRQVIKNEWKVAGHMKRFVFANYYHNITVKDICRDTGLNSEYASKLFQKETGHRPIEYLNRFRVGKAKRLMLELDLMISDIAEMVGFNSVNYFCTVVKKYEHCSPEKLRSKMMEQFQIRQEPIE